MSEWRFEIDGTDHPNRCQDDEESDDVEDADARKNGSVAEPVIEQLSDDKTEDNAAGRAAKADEAGDGTDDSRGDEIAGNRHDERRPRLLAGKCDAEQYNCELDRRVHYEKD